VIHFITDWIERYRGQGEHAITIPVFDGPLKPNRVLEDAEVVGDLTAPEDLATDGKTLFVADGHRVLRWDGSSFVEHHGFDCALTAMCCLPDGGLAVALDGRKVKVVGGAFNNAEWTMAAGRPFLSVNAITLRGPTELLVTEGSAQQPYQNWCHDLMGRGSTGRLVQLDLGSREPRELDRNLHYAFGCLAVGDNIWVSETWKHRVVGVHSSTEDRVIVDWLPGYPCRIAPASDGGYWLCALAGRTQLVEFVLRQNAYRKAMMKKIDPAYWIAPALSSGDDFLEPLQSAHVIMRGVLKPYAPPRSYGLVIKLNSTGFPISSFHSRLDGKNHGVVAAVELSGELFVLSKGRRRILRIPVNVQ
jgi:hypothetical protein